MKRLPDLSSPTVLTFSSRLGRRDHEGSRLVTHLDAPKAPAQELRVDAEPAGAPGRAQPGRSWLAICRDAPHAHDAGGGLVGAERGAERVARVEEQLLGGTG
jgi:hypothetical protein